MSKASYLLKNMWVLTISNFSSKILIFLLVPFHSHNNMQLAYSNAQTLVGLETNRNILRRL